MLCSAEPDPNSMAGVVEFWVKLKKKKKKKKKKKPNKDLEIGSKNLSRRESLNWRRRSCSWGGCVVRCKGFWHFQLCFLFWVLSERKKNQKRDLSQKRVCVCCVVRLQGEEERWWLYFLSPGKVLADPWKKFDFFSEDCYALSLSLSCTVFDSFMLHHNYFVSLLFWVNILVSLVKTTSGKLYVILSTPICNFYPTSRTIFGIRESNMKHYIVK